MPRTFTVRKLESHDQDFLWEMLYLALWDAPDEPRRPRSVLDHPRISRLVEDWGRPADAGMVALDPVSHEPVGAIWARLDGYDQIEGYGCGFPCLGIAVDDAYQNRGVGTLLMTRFIEHVRTDLAGLRLGVHPANEAGIALYKKLGFTQYAVGHGNYLQMKLEFSGDNEC